MSFLKNTRGFTLVELLVVISIIAILASIILTSLDRSQQKSRDARRISDIKEIQLALSLYYNDNGCYPQDIYVSSVTCNGASAPGLAPNYISVVPKDVSTDDDYSYAPLASASGSGDCTSYHLGATLENAGDINTNDKASLDKANPKDSRGRYVCNVTGATSDFDGTAETMFDVTP